MESNVVFDNPYLDRCLRFGWYLDIIMLFLLGNTSLTFRPNPVVNLDYWDHTLDNGWFGVTWFHDLLHIWCHTRAYSVSVEIYGSSWSRMIISTYEIHSETRTCSLFYYDPPVEPLLSHLVRPIFFQHLYAIMLLILGDVSLTFEFVLGYGDHTFDDGWFHVTRFPIYHTSMPYWGIFPFQLRVIDLHGATWSLPLTRCTPRRGRVRYFIMIPQWSLSWATKSSCLTFVCHHASCSGRRFLNVWVRFRLRGLHISCYPIFDLPYI